MRAEGKQILTQGFVAGLIGYAAVAIFFGVVNLIVGRSPFHTAAVLGAALFYGLEDPGRVVIEPGPVFAFNGLHLAASVVAGTVAAWLVFETERHHFLWYFVLMIFLAGFVYSAAAIGVLASEIANVVPWWSVVAANIVWVVALGSYFWFQHRGLVTALKIEQESTM